MKNFIIFEETLDNLAKDIMKDNYNGYNPIERITNIEHSIYNFVKNVRKENGMAEEKDNDFEEDKKGKD